MPIQLYRADNRDPQTIADYGFQAREQLTAEQARALVDRLLLHADTPVTLPSGEDRFRPFIESSPGQLMGIGEVHQKIAVAKGMHTLHVSTAIHEDCCGYGANSPFVYRIDTPAQQFYAWDENPVRGTKGVVSTPRLVDDLSRVHTEPNPITGLPSTKPVLLTDTPDLSTANIVAVFRPVAISQTARDGEVAFLTGVPKEWIGASRARGQHDWQPLPGAAAQAQPHAGAPAAPVAAAASNAPAAANAAVAPAVSAAPQAPSAAEPQRSAAPPPPAKPAALSVHPYAAAGHERHALYSQALAELGAVSAPGLRSSAERTQAAAALADAAHAAVPRLPSIDHVVPGPHGRLFAIHGQREDPSALRAHIDPVPGQTGPAYAQSAQPQAAPAPQQDASAPERSSVLQMARMFEAQAEAPSQGGSGPRR